MRRNLFGIVLMSLATLFACSEQDQELGVTDQATQSVQFSVNVKDLTTRISEGDVYMDDCPDQEGLISAARSNQLEARFKIEGKAQDLEIVRSIKYSDEGEFIADPYDLAKKEEGETPWKLTYFTVWENDGTTEKMLYSAVGSIESEFADFVETNQVLPQNITIGEGDVFNKTTYPVTVICAVNTDAEAFGYKMWDLNFINLQSVSFMVNDCGEDGVHRVLSGKLEVYNDADTTNTVYDEGSVMKTVYFNAGEENKLFLIDHINVNDDKEFYGYKLYRLGYDIDLDGANEKDEYSLRAFGSANVTELSKYRKRDAWMYNMLDINLCDPEGTENWIFDDGLALNELYNCEYDIDEVTSIEVVHYCYQEEFDYLVFTHKTYEFVDINSSNYTSIDTEIFVNINEIDEEQECTFDFQQFKITYKINEEIVATKVVSYLDIVYYWFTFRDYLESSERITTTCDAFSAE